MSHPPWSVAFIHTVFPILACNFKETGNQKGVSRRTAITSTPTSGEDEDKGYQ